MGPHSLAPDHEMVPAKGTARSVRGTNRGRAADLTNPLHYPVVAECRCGQPIRAEGFYSDWQHVEAPKVFYVLVCLECGDPERPLPMPFGSAAERGKWAGEHTRGTGHDNWRVWDETRQ